MGDKEARQYRKALVSLTNDVQACLAAFDKAMVGPSTPARGKHIAKICNALALQNDKIRYFTLGVDWRKDKRP